MYPHHPTATQHTATQHTALQRTATHCNALQCTATRAQEKRLRATEDLVSAPTDALQHSGHSTKHCNTTHFHILASANADTQNSALNQNTL